MFQLWSSDSISGHDSSELVLQPRAQLQLGSQVSMFLSENVDLRRQRPNCLFTITVSQPVPPSQSALSVQRYSQGRQWLSHRLNLLVSRPPWPVFLSLCMARPPRDPSLLSWPWGSASSGSGGPSSAVGLTSLPIVNSHAESAAMLDVVSPCGARASRRRA